MTFERNAVHWLSAVSKIKFDLKVRLIPCTGEKSQKNAFQMLERQKKEKI